MTFDRVTIVLDAAFGAKIRQQAARGPVWVVRSAENEKIVTMLWGEDAFPPDHITTFETTDTPEHLFQGTLEAADEHHFGWTTLEVIGHSLSETTTNTLRAYGEGEFVKTENGFIFTRQPPPF